jgi:MFS family permease
MAIAAPPAPAPPEAPPSGEGVSGRRKRPLIYYGYWLVGIALLAQFVSAGTQAYVAGVFLKPMTADLDWTRAEFTSAQTFGRFIMAFVGLFVGVYVDRGYARTMMLTGVTILGAALFLTSAVTELWQWILLRGIAFTLGAALLGNLVVNVTLSKWWVERRGRMVGFSSMGVSLAGVILPFALTAFVDEFGWQAGWRALAVMAWVLIYPTAVFMRSSPERYGLNPDGRSDEEMASATGARVRADLANSLTRGEALRTPALYMIVIAFGFSSVGLGTMILQTIPFMTDVGFERATASLMLTVLAFPAALTKPIWGWLMDYISPKVLAALSFVIAAIAMVLIVLGGQTGALPLLILGFVLVGVGIGGQIPIQEVIWASFFGRRYLGAVRSVAMPFALFLGAGGPFVVSFYFDRVGNYDGAFLGVGVLWTLAAGLILIVRKPKPPKRLLDAQPPAEPAPPVIAAAAAAPTNGAYGANGAGNGAVAGGVEPSAQEVTAEEAIPAPRARRRPRRPRRDYMSDN